MAAVAGCAIAFSFSLSQAVAGVYWPSEIVATPDGRIWFINGEGAVGVLDPLSGGITQHVAPGRIGTNPRFAIDLVVADGQVWVATGKGIAQLGGAGVVREYSLGSGAAAITRGPDGAIWATLRDAQSIARVTPDGGRAIWQTRPYKGYLEAIERGPDGNLWYADTGDILARMDGGGPETFVRLGRITPHGKLKEWILGGSNTSPHDFVAGPDGRLWVAQANADRIARVRVGPRLRAKIFNVPVGLRHPASLVVGPDRALWFIGRRDGAIGRITTTGRFTKYPLPWKHSGLDPSLDPSPQSLTVGADGALWFTEDSRDLIVRMTMAGEMRVYPIAFLSGVAAPGPLRTGLEADGVPSAVEESLLQPE
ncbi:MAG TPA: hypothetical protein VF712_00060 [Thermoleophilaceae bacterium]